jgi:NAD(P)-dependent dehydrogenase (short-subunit alcohol dehydrogenase family)
LINNAGIAERAPIEELTLESYRRQMDTNLLGPLWLSRALLPSMRGARAGCIVNVASISATVGTASQTVYNASKWALLGFTKSLAAELTDSGVMTVAVLPGAVNTAMLAGSGFEPRMSAEDVARTLVYYALDAPPAHNGAAIEMFGV